MKNMGIEKTIKLGEEILFYDLVKNQSGSYRMYRPISKNIVCKALSNSGMSYSTMGKTLGICGNTVRNWVNQYEQGLYKGVNSENVKTVTAQKPKETTLNERYRAYKQMLDSDEIKLATTFVDNYEKAEEAGIDLEVLMSMSMKTKDPIVIEEEEIFGEGFGEWE